MPLIPLIVYPLAAASLAGCGFLLFATRAVMRFTSAPQTILAVDQKPVTILKPLHGHDLELVENLRSFCRQTYPEFQIIFGVQSPDDPALPVAEAIHQEFPDLDIAIVVDTARPFRNMKVNNLNNMLRLARHPWLVIADSDMRVTPNYLAIVTAPLADEKVGVVTCLYRGMAGDRGLWSRLGAMQINLGFLPQALLGHSFGVGDGCFGATIALRRQTLDEIGGFAAIGDQLADDHALGQAVRSRGLKIELSSYLTDTIVHEPDFAHLFAHETRWARTVFLVQPAGYAGSVLTYPFPLALLASAGLPVMWAILLIFITFLIRVTTARQTACALKVTPPNSLILLMRDLLSFGVFVTSFFRRTVRWRSHSFTTQSDGQLGDGYSGDSQMTPQGEKRS